LNTPWTKYITMENLPNEDMKLMASSIGLDATVKLISEFPGMTFAVPKKGLLTAKIQYIKEFYDGSKTSRVRLAQECDLSENYILRLYKNKNLNNK